MLFLKIGKGSFCFVLFFLLHLYQTEFLLIRDDEMAHWAKAQGTKPDEPSSEMAGRELSPNVFSDCDTSALACAHTGTHRRTNTQIHITVW